MKFRFSERGLVTGVVAAVAGYVLIKQGWFGRIPALGGISTPVVAIILGFLLAVVVDGGGTGGDVIDGIAFGLIVAGAAQV